MNDKNMAVLVSIIGTVESGGQVYGKRRYDAYAAPYTNSAVEYTVTLGWAQNYGSEARTLIQMIYDKDKAAFQKIDQGGDIAAMLKKDWVAIRWNPSAAQKKKLIALIDSEAGHTCQDELFAKLMKTFIADCEKTYTKSIPAIMMYCEIRHLGGAGPVKRIFDRLGGNYSLDMIMASLVRDQQDKSNDNQVGDTKFWTRHLKCKEFIERYAVEETAEEKKEETKVAVHYISNSGGDENGKISGGKAGDQTGKEWCLRAWYNRPWSCILRHPDANVRAKIAELGEAAAKNDKIGYDQSQRDTYWTQLVKVGYDPSKITVACEADCSAGVIANVKATGYLLGISSLKTIGATYTGNMRSAFKAAGFTVLTASKYLTSPDYLGTRTDLRPLAKLCHSHGALLLADNAHGAYLRFLPGELHPLQQGVDLCCDSAHKTLPVLTGGAYLHFGQSCPAELLPMAERAMALFASTSPSYLILQSLDAVNALLSGEYPQRLRETAERVRTMKAELTAQGWRLAETEPLKITLLPKSKGYTGLELAALLAEENLVCEFADPDALVLMITPETEPDILQKLLDTLARLERRTPISVRAPAPGAPNPVMSPKQAVMRPFEEIPIGESLGRILAGPSVSCPPAVPILVCGERVDEQALELFRYYGITKCDVVK